MKTEADELRNSIQYGLGVMDSGSGEFKELSNKIDELFELSYLEGQSNPKIKQLEWKETNYYIEARTKIGKYLTQLSGTSINSESRVQMYFCGTGEIVFDGTLGEAKAAAQADFEKRIKECLE